MTADASMSRSDKARQRRKTRSQERIARAADVVHARPASIPAVTVRGKGMGQPILRQASTQTRRKYYVALDSAGAERSMPALWDRICSILNSFSAAECQNFFRHAGYA